MHEQFPVGALSPYTQSEAVDELKQIEVDMMRRVRTCLEGKACDEIISSLLDIDKEIELVLNESRRLRLQGKLDVNVFNILVKGYSDIKEKIFDLSSQYGFLKQVRSLYNFNKYAGRVSIESKRVGLFNESNTC